MLNEFIKMKTLVTVLIIPSIMLGSSAALAGFVRNLQPGMPPAIVPNLEAQQTQKESAQTQTVAPPQYAPQNAPQKQQQQQIAPPIQQALPEPQPSPAQISQQQSIFAPPQFVSPIQQNLEPIPDQPIPAPITGERFPTPLPLLQKPEPKTPSNYCTVSLFNMAGHPNNLQYVRYLMEEHGYTVVPIDMPKRFLINFEISASVGVISGTVRLYLYPQQNRPQLIAAGNYKTRAGLEHVFEELMKFVPHCSYFDPS